MPSNSYEIAKAFFPGTRNELIMHVDDLLESRKPETTKRIKVSAVKLMGDGRKVGMPTSVGAAYDLIAKPENLSSEVKLKFDVLDMALSVYATDDSERPTHIFHAPKFTRLSVRTQEAGEDEEEVSDINLHMTMYLRASTELWDWLYETQGNPVYIKWETNQKELELAETDDRQMSLVAAEDEDEDADDFEASRRTATSKSKDSEWSNA